MTNFALEQSWELSKIKTNKHDLSETLLKSETIFHIVKTFDRYKSFGRLKLFSSKAAVELNGSHFGVFFWKSFFIHNTHAPVNKRAKTLDKTENRQNAAQFSVVGLAELSEHTLLLNGLFSKPGGWSLGLNYCCCIRLLRIYLFKSSSFLILQHTKSFYDIKRQLAPKLEKRAL